MLVLIDDEQRRCENFRKIDPPQFQDGKTEDEHEFLTMCRDLPDTIVLVESHGVRYITLQLRGSAREWLSVYSGTLPVGSPLITRDAFASAFYDYFIPWSVGEEKRLRFNSLR